MRRQKASGKKKIARKTALHFIDLEQAERKAGTVMVVEKEDVKIIYHALQAYKPPKDEEILHMILLESFEETLVVDYEETPPWKN